MNGLVPLAAIDPFAIILIFLFIVVPLIGMLTAKLREIVQAPPPPQGQQGESRIQDQIEEFLRRAAQRRGDQAPAADQAEDLAVEVLDDGPVGGRVIQQAQKYLDTSEFRRRSEQMGGEVVQADEQFTQQVTQAFSGQVSRLAARPGQAALPSEVAETDSPEPEDASRPKLDALPEAGSGLADLLGTPDNILHAIIMSEILRRPEGEETGV